MINNQSEDKLILAAPSQEVCDKMFGLKITDPLDLCCSWLTDEHRDGADHQSVNVEVTAGFVMAHIHCSQSEAVGLRSGWRYQRVVNTIDCAALFWRDSQCAE